MSANGRDGLPRILDPAARPRRLAVWLLLVFILAGGVRLVAYARTCTVNADATIFIKVAKNFQEGKFQRALDHANHPLYPALIAAVGHLAGTDLETSGYAVSIVIGTLTVLTVFGFARRLFGDRIGLMTAFLFALSPFAVRTAISIKSDAVYYFLFICAAWAGAAAARRRALAPAAAAGAATALAYLARPEGVGFLVVVGLWLLLAERREWLARPLWRAALLVAPPLVWFLLAMPYLLFLKSDQGGWTLTAKKDLGKLARLERMDERDLRYTDVGGGMPKTSPIGEERPVDRGFRIPVAYLGEADYLLAKLIRSYNEFYGLLFLIAFVGVGRRGPPWRWLRIRRDRIPAWGWADAWIGTFFLVYLPALYALTVAQGTVSGRHILPLCIIGTPWAVIGLLRLARWSAGLLGGVRVFRGTAFSRTAAGTLILLLFLLFLGTFFKGVKSRGKQDRGVIEAGRWILAQGGENMSVLTHLEKVPYYAKGRYLNIPRSSYISLLAKIRRREPDFVVIGERRIHSRIPDFFDLVSSDDLVKIHETYEDPDRRRFKILVYRPVYGMGGDR